MPKTEKNRQLKEQWSILSSIDRLSWSNSRASERLIKCAKWALMYGIYCPLLVSPLHNSHTQSWWYWMHCFALMSAPLWAQQNVENKGKYTNMWQYTAVYAVDPFSFVVLQTSQFDRCHKWWSRSKWIHQTNQMLARVRPLSLLPSDVVFKKKH